MRSENMNPVRQDGKLPEERMTPALSGEDDGLRKYTRHRLLYLLWYLYEKTDQEHPTTTNELLEYLAAQDVPTNRKTLKADMDFLQVIPAFDIVKISSKPNRYFWGSRVFELVELRMLVDAVASARFITAKKSQQLLEKLERFASEGQREALRRHIAVDRRVKAQNESIYYIADAIHDAISEGKKIAFNYYEYTAEKERVLRGNGEVYLLSPYTLYWSDDFYYAIGWSEKHANISHFRVDRMTNVTMLPDPIDPPPEGWNVDDYSKKIFEMYPGRTVPVTLECDNELMKYVVDHFGEDVATRVSDEHHFQAVPEVSLSPNFYSWVFRFAGRIRIIAPPEVQQEYRRMAEKALND